MNNCGQSVNCDGSVCRKRRLLQQQLLPSGDRSGRVRNAVRRNGDQQLRSVGHLPPIGLHTGGNTECNGSKSVLHAEHATSHLRYRLHGRHQERQLQHRDDVRPVGLRLAYRLQLRGMLHPRASRERLRRRLLGDDGLQYVRRHDRLRRQRLQLTAGVRRRQRDVLQPPERNGSVPSCRQCAVAT